MQSEDGKLNEKPKGNMLQNENREDDASIENFNDEQTGNLTEKVDETLKHSTPDNSENEDLKNEKAKD